MRRILIIDDDVALSDITKEMLENYEIHFERFEEYRKMIKSEKFFFEEDSRGFIDIMLKKCDNFISNSLPIESKLVSLQIINTNKN